ncbi:MAG: hypothetical protein KDN18_14535 [Verrucomicrobiae bacterium]|nr:hypothetical protein [Verrucomicrobiae bacterium]
MRSLFSLVLSVLLLASCTGKKKADPTASADWRPENASVARHITSVHHFVISPAPESHLRVELDPVTGKVRGEFRKDVLEILGGEKALYILGWDANPHQAARHEYLFFLEALHAYLVLNHPEWDGGEGETPAPSGASVDAEKLTDASTKTAPVEL